jgi:hypothetical protein
MQKHLIKLLATLALLFNFSFPLQAAKEQFYRVKPHVNVSTIEILTGSGDILTADFQSDLTVSRTGQAWGGMRFEFLDGTILAYRAVLGRIEFDAPLRVSRVWVLLVTSQSERGDPLGFAIVSVRPTADDCLIYDFVGPNFGDGAGQFDVPGSITSVSSPRER